MKMIKMFMDMVGYDIYKHLRMLMDVITYHTYETFNYFKMFIGAVVGGL